MQLTIGNVVELSAQKLIQPEIEHWQLDTGLYADVSLGHKLHQEGFCEEPQ